MIIKFIPRFMHGGDKKNVNVQNVQSTLQRQKKFYKYICKIYQMGLTYYFRSTFVIPLLTFGNIDKLISFSYETLQTICYI
ncbi:hypothetical protein V1478_006779 [Vespula squamosa]|uniref:Uncharacterized protein n=1 Tax=Vespula squamosa TaxID=30214 RepID=A0ABD2B181_VESSQ